MLEPTDANRQILVRRQEPTCERIYEASSMPHRVSHGGRSVLSQSDINAQEAGLSRYRHGNDAEYRLKRSDSSTPEMSSRCMVPNTLSPADQEFGMAVFTPMRCTAKNARVRTEIDTFKLARNGKLLKLATDGSTMVLE
jgi:hypothetical protein